MRQDRYLFLSRSRCHLLMGNAAQSLVTPFCSPLVNTCNKVSVVASRTSVQNRFRRDNLILAELRERPTDQD
jgi:hypothetical protein